MNAPTPIRGKVARILSTREIALTVGTRDGVQVGMIFEVLDPKAEDITDPDTEEVLGSIRRPKIRVKVTQADERVSLASTFHSKKVNLGGQGILAGASVARMFEPARWVTKYETLKAEEHQWDELDESESLVKVGDPVVQVMAEPPTATDEPGVANQG